MDRLSNESMYSTSTTMIIGEMINKAKQGNCVSHSTTNMQKRKLELGHQEWSDREVFLADTRPYIDKIAKCAPNMNHLDMNG